MTPQLWIGFAFLALLVIFLIVAYFKGEASSQSQYNTLRFLTALCAGFAGGFLTGDALFKMDQTLASGMKIGISGTAGCALFFAIWFSYPRLNLLQPPETFGLTVPPGAILAFGKWLRVLYKINSALLFGQRKQRRIDILFK